MDLEYPNHLHDAHNDYPLAVDIPTVTKDMLSVYNMESLFGKQTSLIPTLYNKVKYVTHIKKLKLYKHLELRVTKIQRVLEFEQSRWLKSYIDFNTEKRKTATSDFERFFSNSFPILHMGSRWKTSGNA